jgi:hypothetical protein
MQSSVQTEEAHPSGSFLPMTVAVSYRGCGPWIYASEPVTHVYQCSNASSAHCKKMMHHGVHTAMSKLRAMNSFWGAAMTWRASDWIVGSEGHPTWVLTS